MEDEALHIRYLVIIAAVLAALIIGYNAFFVPEVALPAVTADAAASSAKPFSAGETYVPKAPPSGVAPAASKAAAAGKINLNTATAQQLSDGLDGVGTVMAKRIVEYREKNGGFRSVDELKNVSGIGEKTFEKLKNRVTVDGN